MNHAINAGMEMISCGPETDFLQGGHDCFRLPHEFSATEISISAGEKIGSAVPLCALYKISRKSNWNPGRTGSPRRIVGFSIRAGGWPGR